MKWFPLLSVLLLVSTTVAGQLDVMGTETTIELRHGDQSFLTYHKAEVPPPPGADPIFKRSGFIHPLKTPGGATVTGIHPSYHYHHFGLWHAWVKCVYGDDEIDFWNLKHGKGRVTYKDTREFIKGNDLAGFTVIQEQIGYKGERKEPVRILEEAFTIIARFVDGAYEIDYQVEQKNVTGKSLKLLVWRHGGPIAYHAPHHWRNGNSDYLSSEGKTRVDGHATRSRWISMWGPANDKKGSAPVSLTILSHPNNHDAPQRMRIWPPRAKDGAIFFNYVPIQEKAWEIKPGESITMRYRLVLTDEKADVDKLNARWEQWSRE
jgi:hypothetical protein